MLSDLHSMILADGVVAGLAGSRIYPSILPQAPKLPAITYQLVSETRRPTMNAPDNLPARRVQIDAWAARFSQAQALADAIRKAIDGFSGQMDSPGVEVGGIFADNAQMIFEPDTKLHRVSREYIIWARE